MKGLRNEVHKASDTGGFNVLTVFRVEMYISTLQNKNNITFALEVNEPRKHQSCTRK